MRGRVSHTPRLEPLLLGRCMARSHCTDKNTTFQQSRGCPSPTKTPTTKKRKESSGGPVAARQPSAAWYLPGLMCGSEGTERDLEPAVKEQLHLLNTGHWFRVTCVLSQCRVHSNRK